MSQTLAPTKHTNVKYSLKSGAIHKPIKMTSVNNTTLATTTTAPVTTAPVTTAPVTTAPVTTAPVTPYIPFTGNDVSGSFWSNMSSWTSALFNATTMTIVFWILTIYICFHFLRAMYAPRSLSAESSGQLGYSRMIDFLLAMLLIGFFAYEYWQLSSNNQQNIMGFMFEWTYQYFNNPASLIETFIFTVVFFLLVYLFRVPMSPDVKPVLVHLVEHKIWILYACFLIIFFFKYVLNIPIVDLIFNNQFIQYLENLPSYTTPPVSTPGPFTPSSSTPGPFTPSSSTPGPFTPSSSTPGPSTPGQSTIGPTSSPSLSSAPGPASSPAPEMQVFNVGNNNYTYDAAKEVCNAYGAELANYDQIENSYNNGGEWCNYGWSENQMAFFPTQKNTWNILQQNNNTKNACGRPGINGGFIANPYVQFGANCYGVKPPPPPGWQPNNNAIGILNENPTTAPTVNPLIQNAKVNSFDYKEWSRY